MTNVAYAKEIRGAFYELSKNAIGWEDLLAQALFGLLTREHVFWLSEPGRAKSWVARMIFGLFPDAKSFYVQITKDMLPGAVFGEVIPKEYMETGREIINTANGICEANFAFLDEFLDGPDFLVRAMNSVLNERIFERKDMRLKVPLHCGIMTTNFDRYGKALEAVRDRMMCKAAVPRVTTLTDRMRMYKSYMTFAGSLPPLPSLSFADLVALSDVIESPSGIAVPGEVRLLHAFMLQQFIAKRVEAEKVRIMGQNGGKEVADSDIHLPEVTPRTEAKLLDFCRAAAVLDGRMVTEPRDLMFNRYGLVIINSGNGDDECWAKICEDYLPRGSKAIDYLRSLSAIAEKIGHLRAIDDQTNIIIDFAGKAETFTRVKLIELLNAISRSTSLAVKEIAKQLIDEIGKIGTKPRETQFILKP